MNALLSASYACKLAKVVTLSKHSHLLPHLHPHAAMPIHHLQSLPHLPSYALGEADGHSVADLQFPFPFVVAIKHPIVGEGLYAGVFTGGKERSLLAFK